MSKWVSQWVSERTNERIKEWYNIIILSLCVLFQDADEDPNDNKDDVRKMSQASGMPSNGNHGYDVYTSKMGLENSYSQSLAPIMKKRNKHEKESRMSFSLMSKSNDVLNEEWFIIMSSLDRLFLILYYMFFFTIVIYISTKFYWCVCYVLETYGRTEWCFSKHWKQWVNLRITQACTFFTNILYSYLKWLKYCDTRLVCLFPILSMVDLLSN